MLLWTCRLKVDESCGCAWNEIRNAWKGKFMLEFQVGRKISTRLKWNEVIFNFYLKKQKEALIVQIAVDPWTLQESAVAWTYLET